MKLLGAILLLCASAAAAQTAATASPAEAARALREALLNQDRTTSDAVRRHGFVRGLALALRADALLLLDGAPIVRGRETATRWLAGQAELGTKRVQWLPLAVLVSVDGSLGATYGVTTIAPAHAGDSADARFGKYISVWRRQSQEWTLVAHMQTGLLDHPATVPQGVATAGSAPFTAGPGAAFAAADSAFARMAADSGAAAAFAAFAAPTAVTFPATGELIMGPSAIRARMSESRARTMWSWAPRFAGGSEAGDLGFTVGEATIVATRDEATSTSYSKYVTVWRRMPDGSIRFLADGGNARPGSAR